MKEQNFTKIFKTGKMKIVTFLSTLLIAAMPVLSNATCVSFGVTFGNPQSNGGACVGKGVCRETMDIDPMTGVYPAAPEAVSCTFIITSTNPNVILMRFSLSEVMRKQPDQTSTFTEGSSSGYSFDNSYSLAKPQFATMGLPPGASIAAGTKYTVSITGDIVTIYIPYAHEG